MPDHDASSADPVIFPGSDAPAPTNSELLDRHVRVVLPLPLPDALDYLAPDGMAPLETGSFVRVSLGVRNLVGVVWGGACGELPVERLKPILEVLPVPKLKPELRRFVERVAAYTMTPPGSVLRMTMSVGDALQAPRPRRVCAASSAGLAALSGTAPAKPLTPARQRVLEALRDGLPLA